MKVLVTGASGLLGRYMAGCVPDGIDAEFCYWTVKQPWTAHRLDVTNQAELDYVFAKVKPDKVIHMGSVGNVDWCQDHYRDAWRINVEGTRAVISQGAPVLLTSTNAVYSGDNPPYSEDSPREPVNAYGRTRKQAEDAVFKAGGIAARLFLLYGWEPAGARGNWASSAVRKLAAGEPLRIVNDVYYQPTYAGDAAKAVWGALGEWQTANVAGNDRVSLYEFITTLAEIWGYNKDVISPASITEFKSLAPRPGDTTYDLEVACRGIRDGLEAMYLEDCSHHASLQK